jgi:hypothetical protein
VTQHVAAAVRVSAVPLGAVATLTVLAACGNVFGLADVAPQPTGEGGVIDASVTEDVASAEGSTTNDAGADGDATTADPCASCDSKHCDSAGKCEPLVFVTKVELQGTLEGSGATAAKGDVLCGKAAQGVGLTGVYMAWLSDASGGPVTRFLQKSTRRYWLIDGVKVASSFTDITSKGSLENPINRFETNELVPPNTYVWTGTTTGGAAGANRCRSGTSDWSDNTTMTGTVGSATETDYRWTAQADATCLTKAHLYCFEQQP